MLILDNNFLFDAKLNLAIEEAIFQEKDIDDNVLILWQNANAIIIGKNQITLNEVNLDLAKDYNTQIVRRISGGGAVYHDLGNLNFSFILNKNEFPQNFLKYILRALNDYNLKVKLSGRNDLYLNDSKISGCAQAQNLNKLLLHGTLLINSNINRLSSVLTPIKTKLEKNGVKSIKARVRNLQDLTTKPISIEKVKKSIKDIINTDLELNNLTFSSQLISIIKCLYHSKYSQNDWNFNKLEKRNFLKEKQFDSGYIQLSYNLKKDCLKDVLITGDFFSIQDIHILQNQLNGIKLTNLKESLQNLRIDNFILGLTNQEFLDLFRG